MSDLAGTGQLIRLILRRDRARLSAWVMILAILPIGTASAFFTLTPTQGDREAMAATAMANPAFQALLGPIFGTSIGALTAWRVGTFGALLVGLMAVLTVIRHTRDEEESGRAELLGSTVVGRYALPVAAFSVVVSAGLIMAAIIIAGLRQLGLPTAGSVAFGLGYALVAITFAAIGMVAAQVSESTGTTRGIGVSIVGAAFLLRAIGDATDLTVLSWLSPIGWFTRVRAFADEQWWVFGLFGGLTFTALAVAYALLSRRDIGAGIISPGSGPAVASPRLNSALALGTRLHRGSLLGWTLGVSAIAAMFGTLAHSIGDLLDSNPQFAAIFERLGGEEGMTEAFFATAIGTIALVTAAFAAGTVLRLQAEEEGRRADPILATSTSRRRWMTSHLTFSLGGSALMLIIAGAVAATTYGLAGSDPTNQLPGILTVAIWHVLPVWVVAGIATALYGVWPGATSTTWAALAAFAVLGQLGQILQLPQWTLNLSPFTHAPDFALEDPNLVPTLILAAVAAALLSLGYAGIRRRDLM